MRAVIVLDIGKTHVKLFAIEPHGGQVIEQKQASNQSLAIEPYLQVDVAFIWSWLIDAISDLATRIEIEAIIPCAYGSTAALVDDQGLVLPMMDYEAEPPASIKEAYAKTAPDFAEVCCPVNPGSLTLARQLFWQSQSFPEMFDRTRWILPAAQYWAWRLTGKPAMEVTSLGAQTQLWNPRLGQATGLAEREGWIRRFPPLLAAFDELGPLEASLSKRLGFKNPPPVLVGIHDSNANYARYLSAEQKRFTLISSGTWLITFDTDLPLDRLDPDRDMVANTDVEGRPVACTRFMGGREFAEIAGQEGLRAKPDTEDIQRLIDRKTLALPSFTDSGGPFPGQALCGRIDGPLPERPAEKSALAALYAALVTDIDLDLLDSSGDVIIDGSFANNRHYTGLLAALRPKQTLVVSKDSDGTALGASLLWGWRSRKAPIQLDLEPISPINIDRLAGYKELWRQQAARAS